MLRKIKVKIFYWDEPQARIAVEIEKLIEKSNLIHKEQVEIIRNKSKYKRRLHKQIRKGGEVEDERKRTNGKI